MSRARQRSPQSTQQMMMRASAQREAAASLATASTQATVEEQVSDVSARVPTDLSDRLTDFEDRIRALEP